MVEKSMGILFHLKKPKGYKSGAIDVYMKITIDGIAKEVSTKVSCVPEKWNVKKGRATGNTEDIRSINAALDTFFTKARNARTSLLERGEEVTALAMRDLLTGADQRDRTLLKLFKEHNEEMAKLVEVKEYAETTLEMYEVGYRHAEEFIRWKYREDDLNIRRLNMDFVESFCKWFKIKKKDSHNTAIKNIGHLKKIILTCVRRGWLA
ncbi:MAG: phage integrase SAM-like domain-containing protein, partial [Chitinophagaceae bacterium]|nr:phage integrase SAM-like domain-containing protein [Chitinophagaceae bacterium]